MRELNVNEVSEVNGGWRLKLITKALQFVATTFPGSGAPDRYTGEWHG